MSENTNRLLKNDASPREYTGYAQGKDAGSARSSATGATEDAAWRRPVRSRGRGLFLQQPARTTNILLSGVGGQGVLLASYVVSQAAVAEGYDVKQSEVHGMSQRGGSVMSHLRFGTALASPLVTQGAADLLLSFEPLEALRYCHWLRPGGLLIYNTLRVNPSTVASGLATYPADVTAEIAAAWPNVRSVDATALAEEAGTAKAANMVLLGAISGELPFADDTWKKIIAEVVPPKTVDANMKAFDLGRAAGR